MRSIWLLTKKNLKLLVRSKTSALVIFFAPLLIILLLGLSYNTSSKYGLNIGIYAPVFSDDVNALMATLQEQEFKIIKYEASADACVEDLKRGFVHTCLSVPENLKVEENQQKEITFYVDPSKINLVWMIQETLGDKFNLKSQEITKELTGNILTSLSDTKTKLDERTGELSAVKDKSAAASTSAQTVSQQLSSLDLSAPQAGYNPQALADFKSSLSSEVQNSLDEVENSREAVEAANISGDSSILSGLNQIETKLQNINVLINGGSAVGNETGSNSSGAAAESLSSLLTLLEQDLAATKNKLAAASQAVAASSSELSSVSQSMQESVSALEGVRQKLGEIHPGNAKSHRCRSHNFAVDNQD